MGICDNDIGRAKVIVDSTNEDSLVDLDLSKTVSDKLVIGRTFQLAESVVGSLTSQGTFGIKRACLSL